jgi:hypothetical protein
MQSLFQKIPFLGQATVIEVSHCTFLLICLVFCWEATNFLVVGSPFLMLTFCVCEFVGKAVLELVISCADYRFKF